MIQNEQYFLKQQHNIYKDYIWYVYIFTIELALHLTCLSFIYFRSLTFDVCFVFKICYVGVFFN